MHSQHHSKIVIPSDYMDRKNQVACGWRVVAIFDSRLPLDLKLI